MVLAISVMLTFGCIRSYATSTDEIIKNLLSHAETRDCLNEQDSRFIHYVVEKYYKSLQEVSASLETKPFFQDAGILDCFKYTILLLTLRNACKECRSREDFCSSQCEKCLVCWVFNNRTEQEQYLYEAISPEFYRFHLLRVN